MHIPEFWVALHLHVKFFYIGYQWPLGRPELIICKLYLGEGTDHFCCPVEDASLYQFFFLLHSESY